MSIDYNLNYSELVIARREELASGTSGGGATGATGATGPAGSPGGATGATGATGLYVISANVSVGNLFLTLSDASIVSAGYVLGPLGPTGATGAQGPTGERGATGVAGSTGIAGSPGGATGPTGATGATGPQGLPGILGATGIRGATGATGATGFGATGATGPRGESALPLRQIRLKSSDFLLHNTIIVTSNFANRWPALGLLGNETKTVGCIIPGFENVSNGTSTSGYISNVQFMVGTHGIAGNVVLVANILAQPPSYLSTTTTTTVSNVETFSNIETVLVTYSGSDSNVALYYDFEGTTNFIEVLNQGNLFLGSNLGLRFPSPINSNIIISSGGPKGNFANIRGSIDSNLGLATITLGNNIGANSLTNFFANSSLIFAANIYVPGQKFETQNKYLGLMGLPTLSTGLSLLYDRDANIFSMSITRANALLDSTAVSQSIDLPSFLMNTWNDIKLEYNIVPDTPGRRELSATVNGVFQGNTILTSTQYPDLIWNAGQYAGLYEFIFPFYHSGSFTSHLEARIEDMMLARAPGSNNIVSTSNVWSNTSSWSNTITTSSSGTFSSASNVNLNDYSVQQTLPLPSQYVPGVYSFEFNPNVTYTPGDSIFLSLTRYGANVFDNNNDALFVLGATINLRY